MGFNEKTGRVRFRQGSKKGLKNHYHFKNMTGKGERMQTGDLLIIGGNEEKCNEVEILKKFVEISAARTGPIGVLPTASRIPDEVSREYIEVLDRLGAGEVICLDISSRADAESEEIARRIESLAAVFITGGDQGRLAELILGSKVYEALHNSWKKGMPIAGTSAGASIMGKVMIVSSQTKAADDVLQVELGEGFGFLQNLVIDQHFSQRARFGRLLGAIAENTDLMGIGIDENTAILVRNGQFEVFGEHQVFVFDGKEGEFVNSAVSSNGSEELTLSDFKLHTLTGGYRFDLGNRKLLLNGEEGQR
ncbi:MAG: cyanophycinase [Bacillota bacterium]